MCIKNEDIKMYMLILGTLSLKLVVYGGWCFDDNDNVVNK